MVFVVDVFDSQCCIAVGEFDSQCFDGSPQLYGCIIFDMMHIFIAKVL